MVGSSSWPKLVRRSLFMGFILGAVTWFLCVVIPPLSDWAQETASCRGAERIERDVRDGGTVGYGTKAKGTTVFSLRCTYSDGEVKTVGNDEATVAGFVVGFLVGFVPGTVFSLVRRSAKKLRSGDRSAGGTPGPTADGSEHGTAPQPVGGAS